MKDQIKGGKADKKQPSDFDPKQLAEGIKVEMEHTNDRAKAKEIAMDHLQEDADYYKDWDNKEKILFQEKAPKVKKSIDDIIDEVLEKGGQGSGRRGHTTPKKISAPSIAGMKLADRVDEAVKNLRLDKLRGLNRILDSKRKEHEKAGNSDGVAYYKNLQSKVHSALMQRLSKADEILEKGRGPDKQPRKKRSLSGKVPGRESQMSDAARYEDSRGSRDITSRTKRLNEKIKVSEFKPNKFTKLKEEAKLKEKYKMKPKKKQSLDKSNEETEEELKKKQGVPKGADPATHERCVQHLKDQGHDKSSAYAICNAAGAGMKKSEETNMSKSIEEQIEEMADKMEKSTQDPSEAIRETIMKLGSEGLQKALPNLSDEQRELLKSTIAEMVEEAKERINKAVEMDANYSAPRVRESILDTKYDVDKADDDADEKLVIAEAAQHNHQGDVTPEGREGQVIKSELEAIRNELIKSYEDAGLPYSEEILKSAIKERYLAKAKKDMEDKDEKKENAAGKKIQEAVDDLAENEAEEEVKDHEKKMHKKEMKKADELSDADAKKPEDDQVGDGSKGTEGKSSAKKESAPNIEHKAETAADEVKVTMKKSVNWESPNARLMAKTGGRNHHFNVNEYYDECLAKAKEENMTDDELIKGFESYEEELEETEDLEKAYVGFNKLKQKVAQGGAKNPAAVAAAIGRKKYGKERYNQMISAGKPGGKKGKEAPGKMKKSEFDINDLIEKGQDMDYDTYRTNTELAKHKVNGHKSSFNDIDMADAFNMSEEEMKKILGE